MKIALVLAAVLLSPLAAHAADRVGYVDFDRALNECAEGRQVSAALTADDKAHAKAAADAAEAQKAGRSYAQVLTAEQWKKELDTRLAKAREKMIPRMIRILPAIAKAHGLAAISMSASVAYVAPAADITDELVRRYDAGEGAVDKAAELAAAKAKVAALERETASAGRKADLRGSVRPRK